MATIPNVWIRRAVAVACVIWIGSLAAWLGVVAGKWRDSSYPEGALVGSAFYVAQGECAYRDWREWPHHFSPYAPLTYYPVGWLTRAFNSVPTPREVYLIGRAQSLLSLAGIVGLIALIARRLGASWLACLCAAALGAAWRQPVIHFVASYRPDAPQVFFSLLALWIALGGSATWPRILAAGIALGVSMWFKTTSWGIAFALGFWIFRSAGWKRAAVSSLVFAGINLAAALWLNARWEGRLILNMIGSLDNGWQIESLGIGVRDHLPVVSGLVIVAGLGMGAVTLLRGEASHSKSSELHLLAVATLISFAVSLLQSLKVGSGMNYFLEPYTLLCAVLAVGTSLALEQPNTRISSNRISVLRGCAVGIILIGAAKDSVQCIRDMPNVLDQRTPTPLDLAIREWEGELLTFSPSFALERPAPPTILDCVQYGLLARRGRINPEILLEKIRRQDFRNVILMTSDLEMDASWFLPEFLDTLKAHYDIRESSKVITLFERKSTAQN